MDEGWGRGEQRIHSEDTVSLLAFNLSFKQQKKLPSIKSHEIKLYRSTCFERFKALYMSNFYYKSLRNCGDPIKSRKADIMEGKPLWEMKLLSQQVRHTKGTC